MTVLLQINGLTKRFGGVVATDSLSLSVNTGELHALIGPNGAGKTTLIAQLMGELRPDTGHILFAGERIDTFDTVGRVRRGLGRTFQVTQLLMEATARDNVAMALQARARRTFNFSGDARHDRSTQVGAESYLARIGLLEVADKRVAYLSHGEQKQLELATALATEPQLLLLDEPLAGLGSGESSRMIQILRNLKSTLTILLIEHDMDAVYALADRISVLVYGRIIATGDAAAIRANPDVRTAYLGEDA